MTTQVKRINIYDISAYCFTAGKPKYNSLKGFRLYSSLERNRDLNEIPDYISKRSRKELERLGVDTTLLNDIARFSYDEIIKQYQNKYPLIYRVESPKWKVLYQEVTKGEYFSLPFIRYYMKCNRKKTLKDRMNLRRVIREDTNVNTLIYNAWLDLKDFIDNSDRHISLDWILEACLEVAAKPLQIIKTDYKLQIDELKEITYPKSGIIYRRGFSTEERNKIRKIRNQDIFDELYNPELSIVENYKAISKVHSISLRTLKTLCKEKGYTKQNQKEIEAQEILSLYDCNLSIRKNIEVMKEYGLDVSKSKLQRILKTYTDE